MRIESNNRLDDIQLIIHLTSGARIVPSDG